MTTPQETQPDNRDIIKDILLKAAEDVQQGLWCSGSWFSEFGDSGPSYADNEFFDLVRPESGSEHRSMAVEDFSSYHRCAEGSIALATAMAGYGPNMYRSAVKAVEDHMKDSNLCPLKLPHSLSSHNDTCILSMFFDTTETLPFDAGQHLAELFRSTAEAL